LQGVFDRLDFGDLSNFYALANWISSTQSIGKAAVIFAPGLLRLTGKQPSLESRCAKPASVWSRLFLGVIAVLWLCVAVIGFALLSAYGYAPGKTSQAPTHWPSSSAIPRTSGIPTLVMFAHPHCPCTRASLGELEKIAARCQGKVAIKVVVFSPTKKDADWAQTDLWNTAAAIPGVEVVRDLDGTEARRFHASISGQTLLFDDRGDLVFAGGITFARGHAGDNAGRDAIESYLLDGTKQFPKTPVFGCPLISSGETSS
jgi:hypothetical protein